MKPAPCANGCETLPMLLASWLQQIISESYFLYTNVIWENVKNTQKHVKPFGLLQISYQYSWSGPQLMSSIFLPLGQCRMRPVYVIIHLPHKHHQFSTVIHVFCFYVWRCAAGMLEGRKLEFNWEIPTSDGKWNAANPCALLRV